MYLRCWIFYNRLKKRLFSEHRHNPDISKIKYLILICLSKKMFGKSFQMQSKYTYTPIDSSDDFESGDIRTRVHRTGEQVSSPYSLALAKHRGYVLIAVVTTIAVGLVLTAFSSHSAAPVELVPIDPTAARPAPPSAFDSYGRYIMRLFDLGKPMSDFLPGVAGIWGYPLWGESASLLHLLRLYTDVCMYVCVCVLAFFVNRGQGIASFGVQNKDGGIMKFQTANVAYQEVPFTGFRTIMSASRPTASSSSSRFLHMPFFSPGDVYALTCHTGNDNSASSSSSCESTAQPQRNMMIGANELEIEEVDAARDITTNVLYFTVPEEDFPALVRRITVTNTDPEHALVVDMLDGMAQIIPAGLPLGPLMFMGRTMEAWMNVYNGQHEADANGDANNANGDDALVFREPFFHISQGIEDTAHVRRINDGNFAVSFIEDADSAVDDHDDADGDAHDEALYAPLPYIVDPTRVFGTDTSLSHPREFIRTLWSSSQGDDDGDALGKYLRTPQGTTSRTPCAFAGAHLVIPAGGSASMVTVIGHAENLDRFVRVISRRVRRHGYVDAKRVRAQALIAEVTDKVSAHTSQPLLDKYVKQVRQSE